MSTLFEIWNTIQKQLFPSFEQELDPVTEKEREFIKIEPVSKRSISTDVCVALKFQSSKYALYSSG